MLAIISVVYTAVLNRSDRKTDTIQTWTCRFNNGVLDADIAGIKTSLSNAKFGQLCTESVRTSDFEVPRS